jgi:hypothetical protein
VQQLKKIQRDQSRSVNLQGKGLPLASGLVNVLVAGGVGGGDDARELCDLRFESRARMIARTN